MIRQIIKLVLLLYFFAPVLFCQQIKEITFSGAQNFSPDKYLEWSKIRNGQNIFEGLTDSIAARILNGLRSESYLFASIDTINIDVGTDSIYAEISVKLKEDYQVITGDISFAGISGEDSTAIAEKLQYLPGSLWSPAQIETEIGNIINDYENKGSPFITFRTESVNFRKDTLDEKYYADLFISVNNLDKFRVQKIEIEGNEKTKDYVITRAARIGPDDLYKQEEILEIPSRLNRLRFFEPVSEPLFYVNSKEEGVLKIRVKEKETNNFDGIIGYVPPAKEENDGFFTGFVNISLRNLFGTGRAAAVKWEKLERESQELELKYLEPWVLGYPVNISAGLFQRKQDTTYVQRSVDLNLEYLATNDISASFIFESESTIPTESDNMVFSVYNSTSITTGFNLNINTTDDFYAPTRGIIFNNTYKFSSKSIDGPEEFLTESTVKEVKIQRFEIDFEFFHQFFSRQVAALSLYMREMRAPFFEQSDLYRLGGTNTLRGYREQQFLGNRVLWSNLEYRYLLSNRSYLFLFLDNGYYLRSADDTRGVTESSAYKTGYGLGINIETGLGVMGVSYAMGAGDSFSEGKIHFGLINEF